MQYLEGPVYPHSATSQAFCDVSELQHAMVTHSHIAATYPAFRTLATAQLVQAVARDGGLQHGVEEVLWAGDEGVG